MDRDPFGHRKYHGLYFVLGFIIAVVVVLTLSGCERGTTDKGRDCIGFAGMTIEGEECEVIVWPEPIPEPVNCCLALIPSCMACADSCTVDEWLEKTCGPNTIDAEYAALEYSRNRETAYPSLQEQLDMQYWDAANGTTTWKDHVA